MKAFIQMLMPTGHLYEIPTVPIAMNRAAYMLGAHPDEFKSMEEALRDTEELFEDNSEIRDWFLNQMNPEDYRTHMRLVRYQPPEFLPSDGDFSYHDAPAVIAQLDPATVLDQPLEMSLAAMAAHRNLVQMVDLKNEQGQPASLIVLIQGGPVVVTFFQGGIARLTQNLLEAARMGANAAVTAATEDPKPH